MKKILAVMLSVLLAFSAIVSVSAVTVEDNKGNSIVGADALFADFDPTTLTDLFVDFDMTVLFAGFDLGQLLGTFDLATFLQGLDISTSLDSLFSGSTLVGNNRVGAGGLGEFELPSLLGNTDISSLSLPSFDTGSVMSVADFDLGGVTEMLGSFDLGGVTDMLGGLFGGSDLLGGGSTSTSTESNPDTGSSSSSSSTQTAEPQEQIENAGTGGY